MKILFIIPGDINLPTGGYRYDKAILEEWKKSKIAFELISLSGSFPFPSKVEIDNAIIKIDSLPRADVAIVDGLAGGAMPDFLKVLSEKMPVIALVHHPLSLESGLSAQQKENLHQSELEGLKFVKSVVTTSETTANSVAEIFKFEHSIDTVLPGVERATINQPSSDPHVQLLCVGSIIKRKGHSYLIEALANLKHLNWSLKCVGMIPQEDLLYKELSEQVKQNSLQKRILFTGSISDEEMYSVYSQADIFVLPSLYEGYGMAYAEAIVRGIPVIGTNAGAIPQTVPSDCGILVEAENAPQLQLAIEKMVSNHDLRSNYAAACRRREADFPTWQQSAKQLERILKTQL